MKKSLLLAVAVLAVVMTWFTPVASAKRLPGRIWPAAPVETVAHESVAPIVVDEGRP